jgi:outer membrane biosynthesis protein TonB
MPFVLIIIGLIVALGLGGYFFSANTPAEPVAIETPAGRTEETTTPTTPTETLATPDEPVPTEPVVPPTPTTPTPKPSTPAAVPPTPTPTTPKPTPVTPTAPATTYRDGTYNVNTSYVAPGRSTHDMAVSITVANDVVTASAITYSGDKVDTSSSYQSKFGAAYKAQVVGKSLDAISLSRVGGASLTTGAYNKALTEVMTKARI